MKRFAPSNIAPAIARNFRAVALAFLAAVLLSASAIAAEKTYLPAGVPDATHLLAPPPLADSPEQSGDLDEVRAVVRAAGSNDVAQAHAEKKINVFNFASTVGDFFQPGKFPKSEAFFAQVQHEAGTVTDGAKEFFKRPRPFVVDTNLATGNLEKTFSYPSGHSTDSMVLGLVLADMFPSRRDAILAHARTIGWHRVQIARHYPTDVFAGRVLAQAIVREMKKDRKFRRDFAAAQTELSSAMK